MDTQTKLGNALFGSLIKLRGQKGEFDMADVGALFQQISATLHPSDSGIDHGLKEEIERLAIFIEQAKGEISAIGASGDGKKASGDATLHLEAIVKTTEEASHAIMDAVGIIQTSADAVGGEHQKKIGDAINKIYEACNFQDLTGQRIKKVIKILVEIDARIHTMLELFGGRDAQAGSVGREALTEDEKLLNGPQLPDQAPSQDDIDALFGNGKV